MMSGTDKSNFHARFWKPRDAFRRILQTKYYYQKAGLKLDMFDVETIVSRLKTDDPHCFFNKMHLKIQAKKKEGLYKKGTGLLCAEHGDGVALKNGANDHLEQIRCFVLNLEPVCLFWLSPTE